MSFRFQPRHRYLPRLTAVAALTVALFGACTSGEESEDPVRQIRSTLPPNPCRVLSKAEIEASAGARLEDGVENAKTGTPPPMPVVGMRFCLFKSSEPGGPIVQIGVVSSFASEIFEKLKSDPSLQPLIPLESLGQEALSKESGPIGWVAVLNGDKVLGVHVSFVKTNPLEVAQELALKALPAL